MKDIDFTNIPKHIGIIMDGNGRWAKNRFLPRIAGHKEGMNRVVDIVEECCKIGVKTLTLYAFSTENWKRPEEEVNGLMNILVIYINSQLKRILDNNIIFRVIGDYSKLPGSIVKLLDNSINVSKNNTGMVLNIALNYGGRAEIISSIKNLYNDISQGKFSIDDLNEESFKKYLYTKENSEVDLIIRTGNEAKAFKTDQEAFYKYLAETKESEKRRAEAFAKKMEDLIKTKYSPAKLDDDGVYSFVVKQGKGDTPKQGQTLTMKYKGSLLENGKVFDDSDMHKPLEFPVGLGRVIPGFDSQSAKMTLGEKRIIIIPPHLAYGEAGAGGVIPPNAYLVFELELLNIK